MLEKRQCSAAAAAAAAAATAGLAKVQQEAVPPAKHIQSRPQFSPHLVTSMTDIARHLALPMHACEIFIVEKQWWGLWQREPLRTSRRHSKQKR